MALLKQLSASVDAALSVRAAIPILIDRIVGIEAIERVRNMDSGEQFARRIQPRPYSGQGTDEVGALVRRKADMM
ncbi:hypothetical protein [Novosphingobium sp.]|uniref:hypothetical protein n=1 Tax=Novosphingobium sp. TaxID=1874826 RepID=UPI0038BD912E